MVTVPKQVCHFNLKARHFGLKLNFGMKKLQKKLLQNYFKIDV